MKTEKTDTVRVLIADDDPIVRHAVHAVLNVPGNFEVVGEAEAVSAREAETQ